MAGRYLSRNEGAGVRAAKNNLWIRYIGKWYHPDEFNQRFGGGLQCRSEDIQLLNPLPYLHQGRAIIREMVKTSAPIAKIMNALTRLHDFEDKLRFYGFREKEHQLQQIAWPDEKEPVSKNYLKEWEEKNKPKPPEPIDYDAVDVIPPDES